MLQELTVKNFAIIEELSLSLASGLNVLTGETGAGKSIIVDAVGLLLGGRASSDFIREGEERSYLEGVFDCQRLEGFSALLGEMGIETEDGEPLIMSREISRSGRNICRINGRTVTLNQFREVGQYLIDLHGQQEQQSLLSLERQMVLLDSFAGEEAAVIKNELRGVFDELQQTQREIEHLRENERDAARRSDLLAYQAQEIKAARLQPGEEEMLQEEKNLLLHAEKLAQGSSQAYQWLYGGDGEEAAFDLMSRAVGEMRQLGQYDSSLQGLIEDGENALTVIEEIARQVRRYHEAIDLDPRRLGQVEERLALIYQLKRKYGDSIEEILEFYKKAQESLERLGKNESMAGEMEKRRNELKEQYQGLAVRLSKIRMESARRLEEAMADEFASLHMPEVRFEVRVADKGWTSAGTDEIEFMLSPNPGEPLKSLSRIASGGETSRIMLALKTILARVDRMPTLIFDEIDTGIGGRALEAVAARLRQVSEECQVVCVTHAPQIASRADSHLLIDKKVDGGRTRTGVSLLSRQERVQEIARMLAGNAISAVTLRHAEEMLQKGKTGVKNK